MKRLRPTLLAFWVAVGSVLAAGDWKAAEPDFRWSFPRDHWVHRGYRTEWWYLTGHLHDPQEPQRYFGYQFTLFSIGLLTERPALESEWAAQSLIMGHAAVSDPSDTGHRFSELLFREIPLLGAFNPYPEALIARVRAPAGTPGEWALRWNGEGFDVSMRDDARRLAFELTTTPLKPLVLQGPNGLSRKGRTPGAASLYYSFTRLLTEGTLVLDGRARRVRGESWMDKEFSSSQLSPEQVGWDWFSLQLHDGRELMIYALRRADGSTDFAHGTLVSSDGEPVYLDHRAWRLRVTENWTSTETQAVYPARWILELPEEDLWLELEPVLADQENRSRLPGGVFYWEGAVRLWGRDRRPAGRGYVELTGYGEQNRPPV